MKKLNTILLVAILATTQLKSQIGIIENLFDVPLENTSDFLENHAIQNAKILMEEYLNPLGTSLGSGLNSGWHNTGKPHNFPGFDITFGGHTIMLPSASKTFSTVLMSGEELKDIPTISGSISQHEDSAGEFPGGGDWNNFFMPYMQASVGLIYNTECLFRYMPPIAYSNISANYWGFGIKHDVKQHIPIIGDLPFDASVLAAYSQLRSSYEYTTNKSIDFDVQAFNFNMILSKKIAILTAYTSIGYQHSTSNLLFDGIWDYLNDDTITTSEDPINLSLGGVNGLKTNIGARIKLLFFTIHADYTLAEYNIFTIGFGFNSDIGSKLIGGSIGK